MLLNPMSYGINKRELESGSGYKQGTLCSEFSYVVSHANSGDMIPRNFGDSLPNSCSERTQHRSRVVGVGFSGI